MTIRGYGLAGLGIACVAGALLAQSPPRPDNLPSPGLATPNFSQAVLKPPNVQLKVPSGFSVSIYAEGLPGVRWMQWAPNGDLFVSQYGRSTITVLRDTHNAGKPNLRMTYASGSVDNRRDPQQGGGVRRGPGGPPQPGFLSAPVDTVAAAIPCVADATLPPGTTGIQNPMGMEFRNGFFYVANTDSVVRYKYTLGDLEAVGEPQKLVDLPSGGSHGWRNILFNRNGTKLYVTVGSASNNRAGEDCRRAAILEMNPDGTGLRIFASGLRNPEGLALHPRTNRLWTTVNERDSLGDDLVPDYLTSVKEGGFYGWPYSYFGSHIDKRVSPQRPELVAKAVTPDYALGPHTASLGLAYSGENSLAEPFRHGMFVGQHGSWNRKPRSGYKVVFVAFKNGQPVGAPLDVLTEFVADNGDAMGRPVGVAIDQSGALLVADDVGNTIWRVAASPRVTTQ